MSLELSSVVSIDIIVKTGRGGGGGKSDDAIHMKKFNVNYMIIIMMTTFPYTLYPIPTSFHREG